MGSDAARLHLADATRGLDLTQGEVETLSHLAYALDPEVVHQLAWVIQRARNSGPDERVEQLPARHHCEDFDTCMLDRRCEVYSTCELVAGRPGSLPGDPS